jgi:hypothetical protein
MCYAFKDFFSFLLSVDEDELDTEAQSGSVIKKASGTALPTSRPIIPMQTVSDSRCEGLEGELETSRDTSNANSTSKLFVFC